jgi:hypothetical protein
MNTYILNKLQRDSQLRLFPQLHQTCEEGRRASGRMYCEYCGLLYSQHPIEEEYNIDHRLCNGSIVHL